MMPETRVKIARLDPLILYTFESARDRVVWQVGSDPQLRDLGRSFQEGGRLMVS